MFLTELLKFDSNLKVVFGSHWSSEIIAISSLDLLIPNGVIFVKNIKFFELVEASFDEIKSKEIGLIIDEKFYLTLSVERQDKLKLLPWLLTSSNIPLSLTHLSKPYYDKKMKTTNFQVDGRQMGTVDIDPTARISQNVFIGENVQIGKDVTIMPGVVILPNVEIDDNTTIYPNVTIYPFTKIGKECRIHAGVVIGSDGFGYTFFQGEHVKIWHMGGVEIRNNVEIGSNSTVDMGTFSPTIIESGTKIDNLVQVAHNTKMGKGCIVCGQAGLAGSAVLEDFVVLGGRAAIGPDVRIGKGSQVAGGAKVSDGGIWPAGSKLGGHPARDLKEWMRGLAYLRNASLKEKK